MRPVRVGFRDKPFTYTNKTKKTKGVLLGNMLLGYHVCYDTVVQEAEKTFAISGRYLETEENKPIFEIKKMFVFIFFTIKNYSVIRFICKIIL